MSTNGHTTTAPPILLTIAGFDPSCGAGTVADLKTFAAHGCYGVAAITSLTVQNTQGVEAVHNTPSAELREQLEIIAKDCDIAAVKIGMLGNRGHGELGGQEIEPTDDFLKSGMQFPFSMVGPMRHTGEHTQGAGASHQAREGGARDLHVSCGIDDGESKKSVG